MARTWSPIDQTVYLFAIASISGSLIAEISSVSTLITLSESVGWCFLKVGSENIHGAALPGAMPDHNDLLGRLQGVCNLFIKR